ncbi:hypothetical protein AB0F72_20970 [Actinoplanes sp. NPDC023936]|uniref:hypothetical protein n=1 Tax=Actinoplanes sp. NPDC023936 TaxID=3154910 RepID=UPI00340086B5
MDRKTAERLLRGGAPGHPLAEVLSAAKAPATERELSGEAAAMAAFRAAAPAPRRHPMLTFLSFKVAAAAFATTATVGGVALAASTGTLPSPIFASSSAKPSHAPSSPSPSRSLSPSPSRSLSPGASPTPPHSPSRGSSPRPRSSPPASAKPRIELDDLCREFDGRDRDGRTRALDDDRFGELIERAGRKERVERFCSDFRKPRTGSSATPRWPGSGPDGGSGSDSGGFGDGFEWERREG